MLTQHLKSILHLKYAGRWKQFQYISGEHVTSLSENYMVQLQEWHSAGWSFIGVTGVCHSALHCVFVGDFVCCWLQSLSSFTAWMWSLDDQNIFKPWFYGYWKKNEFITVRIYNNWCTQHISCAMSRVHRYVLADQGYPPDEYGLYTDTVLWLQGHFSRVQPCTRNNQVSRHFRHWAYASPWLRHLFVCCGCLMYLFPYRQQ